MHSLQCWEHSLECEADAKTLRCNRAHHGRLFCLSAVCWESRCHRYCSTVYGGVAESSPCDGVSNHLPQVQTMQDWLRRHSLDRSTLGDLQDNLAAVDEYQVRNKFSLRRPAALIIP